MTSPVAFMVWGTVDMPIVAVVLSILALAICEAIARFHINS